MNRTEIRAWSEPWTDNGICVRIGRESFDESGKHTGRMIAMPLQWWILKPEDHGTRIEPTFNITPGEAQQFMDELWRAGIRPTEAAGSVGQLAATTRHLQDMRALVFNPLGIQPPKTA